MGSFVSGSAPLKERRQTTLPRVCLGKYEVRTDLSSEVPGSRSPGVSSEPGVTAETRRVNRTCAWVGEQDQCMGGGAVEMGMAGCE